MRNALTVDVEDYFQVQAFAGTISEADWATHEPRVEANTHRVLDLFAESSVHATFFVLGWVAERYPALITRMNAEGHEVASHGMRHVRVGHQSPEAFFDDISTTKKLLEDTAGAPVIGYRAASFSIDRSTPWAHEQLAKAGYVYSSSVYPVKHDIYGMPGGQRFSYVPEDAGLTEIPVTTVRAFGKILPCGGGGYFRLFPYAWSRWAWRQVNRVEQQPAMFYFHPWEIDPGQPRQATAPLKSKLRHYARLGAMEGKIKRALQDFQWDRMDHVFLADA
ncbi:MAG: XrtA system polysaccharide deacetylase [Alphaproteobacteria bacterium]